MSPDIRDRRAVERYLVVQPLVGSFGAAAITVVDIAEQGAQIEHAQPLRLGARGRFWFKRGKVTASASAFVIWSRLSKMPNTEGKLLYRSGLRLEEGNDFTETLQALVRDGVIERDAESLERKPIKLVNREDVKSAQPAVKLVTNDDVSPDQVLLIQHARERLAANPAEARKWYERAKHGVTIGTPIAFEIRGRHDVLAVWEYLDRSIPLSTIVRVFGEKRN